MSNTVKSDALSEGPAKGQAANTAHAVYRTRHTQCAPPTALFPLTHLADEPPMGALAEAVLNPVCVVVLGITITCLSCSYCGGYALCFHVQ